MRALFAALAVGVTACGAPSGPSPPDAPTTAGESVQVDPERIDRVRGELPGGYEVADVEGLVAPAALWGFGAAWTADPPRCGALADPVVEPASARGWSGSGAGGIVYATVAHGRPLDPAVLTECGRWTMSGGRTSGSVTITAAPAIEGAETVGMTATTTTVVEGGTETRSHADTISAYLGDYVAFVTVVTDPGSPNPQLGQDFAAELMAKTVSALRG